MSLPAKLRVCGWIVSLIGAATLVLSGGYSDNPGFFFSGAVIMVLGIIVTSTSTLVATLQARRRISERLAEYKHARPETPEPPK